MRSSVFIITVTVLLTVYVILTIYQDVIVVGSLGVSHLALSANFAWVVWNVRDIKPFGITWNVAFKITLTAFVFCVIGFKAFL
ncbi:MAG: hypothetical protein ABJH98_17975 [Reichenbachiella sp.]|uniref:hypothetical protein n=1 Tax=Reichenbachiella sp. TaxID=2184521 RepID=UPI003296ED9C